MTSSQSSYDGYLPNKQGSSPNYKQYPPVCNWEAVLDLSKMWTLVNAPVNMCQSDKADLQL